MSEELKPCPFCGSKNLHEVSPYYSYDPTRIECECGAINYRPEWQKRKPDPAIKDIYETYSIKGFNWNNYPYLNKWVKKCIEAVKNHVEGK